MSSCRRPLLAIIPPRGVTACWPFPIIFWKTDPSKSVTCCHKENSQVAQLHFCLEAVMEMVPTIGKQQKEKPSVNTLESPRKGAWYEIPDELGQTWPPASTTQITPAAWSHTCGIAECLGTDKTLVRSLKNRFTWLACCTVRFSSKEGTQEKEPTLENCSAKSHLYFFCILNMLYEQWHPSKSDCEVLTEAVQMSR